MNDKCKFETTRSLIDFLQKECNEDMNLAVKSCILALASFSFCRGNASENFKKIHQQLDQIEEQGNNLNL